MQEFKGYVFKIMGGQDKQGFPMKQGVLTNGRVQVRKAAAGRSSIHQAGMGRDHAAADRQCVCACMHGLVRTA